MTASFIHNYSLLLQLSILVPLACAGLLFFPQSLSRMGVRAVAFIGFLAPCVIALWLAYTFSPEVEDITGYAYVSSINTGLQFIGIHLHLGLNGISMPLFLLAGIVGLAAGLYAMGSRTEREHAYYLLLLIMLSGLMGTFASIDIFFFYFFHELALIPTFIMIGIWGGQNKRSAAIELTIYLTLGALLTLVGLIAVYAQTGFETFNIIELRKYFAQTPLDALSQNNIFALLLIGFGILVSLFPFHSWAPRGYAAAPSSAAMLHAGVLKKFGLYGIIQIAAPLLPQGAGYWFPLLAWLALGNIIIIGLITMAQQNLKLLAGYSSVMHMGYCFLGIVCLMSPSGSATGIGGALLLMFAHGLSIALLFMLSTSVFRRTHTYDLGAMGGLAQKTPALAALFIASMLAGIGLPGFANFWGELSIFIALWHYNPWMLALAALGVILSAVYGLRAVAKIFFKEPSVDLQPHFNNASDIGFWERLPALILLIALLWVGFWPKTLTRYINPSVEKLFPQTSLSAHSSEKASHQEQNA